MAVAEYEFCNGRYSCLLQIYILDTSIRNLSLVYFRLKTAASSDILYL